MTSRQDLLVEGEEECFENNSECNSEWNNASEENLQPYQLGDLVLDYLEQLGVEAIFGVPGGAIEPLYNALGRSKRHKNAGIRAIVARHESGAAFMADGYARETGRLGVCCATSGPGATNLFTGVACAYENDIPLLIITGQPAMPLWGKGALQESHCTGINIVSMFDHCTHYNSLVSHPDQLEPKLAAALQHAMRISRGPVHLSIPRDILSCPSKVKRPSYRLDALLAPPSLIDEASLKDLFKQLSQVSRIAILIGAGCGEAVASILHFAQLRNADVLTTADGKGLVSSQHPLFQGVFGFGGHKRALSIINDPAIDLILAIGVNLGEWNSCGWNEALLGKRLIHIDEIARHFIRTPMAALHVQGRISSIFEYLVNFCMNEAYSTPYFRKTPESVAGSGLLGITSTIHALIESPEAYQSDAVPLKPQRIMKELGELFPPGTRFFADSGNSFFWATHYLHPMDRRVAERRFEPSEREALLGRRGREGSCLRVVTQFAPMGWAIGASVGTAFANQDIPVVCITGDGSMLMNGQEVSTAVAERLTIVFVILNDAGYGMVRHGQQLAKAERIASELPETDFAAFARALGAEGYTIKHPKDFQALDISYIIKRKGPTVLDVWVDRDEISPIKERVKALLCADKS